MARAAGVSLEARVADLARARVFQRNGLVLLRRGEEGVFKPQLLSAR